MPFAGMMGFLTPMLVDRWSSGDPDRAGRAYAVNVLGCIIGPLLAGFLLLPLVGEQLAMLFLVLPWFVMALPAKSQRFTPRVRASAYALVLGSVAVFFLTQGYEFQFPERRVLRDSTATVIAKGVGPERRLLVNGMGMAKLTPITKMMTHLTLASLDHPPQRVLVVCFGMGTSFRSAESWGISSTVVELVPSVPKLVTFYHADGDKVLSWPLGHVVIDDGRRFLERYDFLLCPVNQLPPYPVAQECPREIAGVRMENYLDWMKSCYYITITSHPAISVPAGFTGDPVPLPVGLQIVGRYRDDFGVLQLAHAFEQQTRTWLQRPSIATA
jgi:hypothetical protein